MSKLLTRPTRRAFVRGSAAAVGFGTVAAGPLGRALAQDDFPNDTMRVVIPTGEGGGAERIARSFSDVWRKYLGVGFEYEFYPGAAGQVGYELYVGRKEPNAYNLLFGNMGPEIMMYVLQDPGYRFPDDYVYFCRVDVDDSVLFVRADSPFRSIEDVVEEAQRRPVTVATSRLPHPASLGTLALGEATGADFNLVPYGGGNPTVVATLSGEVDVGILPTGNPISLGDQVRVLTVFAADSAMSHLMGDPPPVNEVFGTDIPDLPSARAWGIHSRAVEEYPERFEKLDSTAREVFEDPEFEEIYRQTGAPWEAIRYGDQETCTEYALAMIELTERYRDLLTGS